MARLRSYAWTVSHLRPLQVAALLRHRVLGLRTAPVPGRVPEVRRLRLPGRFLDAEGRNEGAQVFFLNEPRPLDLAAIHPWAVDGLTKLWRYNAHYFDFLLWPSLDSDTKARAVEQWIADNPAGREDAWEPYPIALRLVNWIKWLWSGAEPTEPFLRSLALQAAWLERNLEYHLLANHLLKNAKALVFAGACLAGGDGDRILRRGLRLMLQQVREQMLPDGGHYERSLSYHALALEDILDVATVLAADPRLAGAAEIDELVAAAGRARDFLADLVHGDGEIALFNDAAFGVSPPPAKLQAYAGRVLAPVAATREAVHRVCKPDTGYFGYRAGGDSLLIDCGPGGPDYQPGHTHADCLSYELCLDGRRIVVDSGVFDYENTPLRAYLRGTAAHSTVRVDGQDQSEVWGAFRVARRARPLYAELGPLERGRMVFRGAHDGYRRLPGRVIHERRITADVAGTWDIDDQITGSGEHQLESIINLHPACSVKTLSPREFLVSVDSRPVVRIVVTCPAQVDLSTGIYCPEFGKKLENTRLVLRATQRLPARLGYTIQRA